MSDPILRAEEGFAGDQEAFIRHLSDTFRMPALRLEDMRTCAPAFDLIAYTDATRHDCVALRSPGAALLVALGNPYDHATQDWLEEVVRQPFSYRIAHYKELRAYLSHHEEGLRAMDALDAPVTASAPTSTLEEISIAAISEESSALVKLLSSTLHDALKYGASDIHFETGAQGLGVKYRIDGVLAPIKQVAGIETADKLISRIKVVSELDIAERRVPQDGRFRARHKGREIDFRVSIMPSVHGEDAVLRILDKKHLSDGLGGLTLEQLGFEQEMISSLRALAAEPHGMLLVTGPTGSGKTTTLYALLSQANDGTDKIVTIEDPVEYQLQGVLQIPVNEKKGLSFARGLRSILRHDPDRIMVGEIRDPETAEIAVQAALTGHVVYTTVHANSVFDVIGRFAHMGTDAFNLASALNGVVAQRLVRLLCRSCEGRGCAACAGTGYRGRKAIAELMVLNDTMRELIVSRAHARTLREAARSAGTKTLREAALELVKRGETTTEEIDRVTSVAR